MSVVLCLCALIPRRALEVDQHLEQIEEWHAYVASDEDANDEEVKRKAKERCRKAAAKAVAKRKTGMRYPLLMFVFLLFDQHGMRLGC